jgi:hypothetical protein
MAPERAQAGQGFMLQPCRSGTGTAGAANLPETTLLYKRPPSYPSGVSAGLSDYSAIVVPGASFALSGPSAKLDPAHLPVRGDLAHIRLAGRVFVPHYVVPMPHLVEGGGAVLRSAGKADAEVMDALPAGTLFNLLDTSGAWAWGQVGDDGLVGYVLAESVKPVA